MAISQEHWFFKALGYIIRSFPLAGIAAIWCLSYGYQAGMASASLPFLVNVSAEGKLTAGPVAFMTPSLRMALQAEEERPCCACQAANEVASIINGIELLKTRIEMLPEIRAILLQVRDNLDSIED